MERKPRSSDNLRRAVSHWAVAGENIYAFEFMLEYNKYLEAKIEDLELRIKELENEG